MDNLNLTTPWFLAPDKTLSVRPTNNSGQLTPFSPPTDSYMIIIYGYLSPFVILVTLINNIIVCCVLMKKMAMTNTHLFLFALAISDTLTGLCSSPYFIYTYTFGNYGKPLPYNMCWVHEYLLVILPTMFHTVSIWLTLALSIQRYMCVCFPLRVSEWSTKRNCIAVIVFIYAMGIVAHVILIFTRGTHAVSISKVDPDLRGCYIYDRGLGTIGLDTIYGTYYTLRVVFIHVIPCTALIVLNLLLLKALHRARRWRRVSVSVRTGSSDQNRTTLMMVVIVTIFLMVELPLGVYFIIYTMSNLLKTKWISDDDTYLVSTVVNFLILLTYPFNFFIYCVISKQFRRALKSVVGTGRRTALSSNRSEMNERTEGIILLHSFKRPSVRRMV